MLETIVCDHEETVEGELGTIQIATCSVCGQTRQFKDTDEESVVITKLGRIDGKIVIPKAGTRFAITPEETRWLNEGRDMMREKQEEAEFQEKMRTMTKASPPVPVQEPEVETGKPIEDGGAVPRARWGRQPYRVHDKAMEALEAKKGAILEDIVNIGVRQTRKKYRINERQWGELRKEWNIVITQGTRQTIYDKFDDKMQEVLDDYTKMTISALEKKWHLAKHGWYYLKQRWVKQGVTIPDGYKPQYKARQNPEVEKKSEPTKVRAAEIKKQMGRPRTGKATNCIDCGVELYIAKNRIREGKVYRCRRCMSIKAAKAPRKRTPTVREEVGKTPKGQGKEFLRANDKIEITVGRLEELLREIEWLRGYLQAVLDIAGIQENTAKEQERER